jgi:hypothetical protein
MSMKNRKSCLALSGVIAFLAGAAFCQAQGEVQTFPLVDTAGLEPSNAKVEAVEFQGRKAVRLTVERQEDGMVILPGTDFRDGVIEADIALKLATPPGVRNPGFYGIAFRVRPDASHYDLFYLRPGNANSGDQAMRNHSAQYTAAPDHPWHRLRREWPWVYESHADIKLETWTKINIEVAGRAAKLFLNGSSSPTLVVDGLKGEDLHGAVALWGYSGEESYFSNLRITRAADQPVTNGSDAAGAWEVHFKGDAGPIEGTMRLARAGGRLTGVWSGGLGESRALAGLWRDGYVELSFTGEWPGGPLARPVQANVLLAGWIDGKTGRGRMRVEGCSEGVWSATMKQ